MNVRETKPYLSLLLLSCTALFLELAFIRYVPGNVRVLGYFTNLILIASFLGLGAGALLSRFETRLFRYWPCTLLAVVIATLLFGSASTGDPAGEHIWRGDAPFLPAETVGWLARADSAVWNAVSPWFGHVDFYVVVTVLFLLVALHFALLGQEIGRRFRDLQPLRAYGYDLGGSILGVLLFSGIAAVSTPPAVWFVLGIVGMSVLTPWRQKTAGAAIAGAGGSGAKPGRTRTTIPGTLALAAAAALALLLVLVSGSKALWSPYYKIEVSELAGEHVRPDSPGGDGAASGSRGPLGYRIRVNNDYHQMALDLRPHEGEDAFIAGWRRLYDLPYEGHAPGDVLVVGAGTGNDVQAALRARATSITAVEIDPLIIELGQRLHPERPYDDARVTVVIDDARAFLKGCSRRFDTVVFGFLDSHTLLSSFSTLRIDNYVYTVQSFLEAAPLLRPGGRLAVTFTTATPWLKDRLFYLTAVALGKAPSTTRVPYTNGRVFWGTVGKPSANGESATPDPSRALALAHELSLPTDDWPFLYLESPGLPAHYLYFIAIVIVLGAASFLLVEKRQRRVNAQFFFLGAGFMLLETRSVTEIALLFGSTWVVNAIAFTSILAAVLLANLVVVRIRRLPPLPTLYIGVVLLLAAGYLVPSGGLFVSNLALRLALCAAVLFSPIFVAGLVFSSQFRCAPNPNLLFGSNLLGAMVGGALEYGSLFLGLSPLYLVGAVLYLLALMASVRDR